MNFTSKRPKTINHNFKATETKKESKVLKRAFYFFIATLLLTTIYTSYEFYNTHDFRTPILININFENPLPRKVITIESPMGSRSALLINKAYAEEVKNPYNAKSPKGIAWEVVKTRFGTDQWEAFDNIVTNESGWNPYAQNGHSSACGLGQSLPCSKMGCEQWDYACQINWVADYIANRYKTPNQAWQFWITKHEVNGNWVNYY